MADVLRLASHRGQPLHSPAMADETMGLSVQHASWCDRSPVEVAAALQHLPGLVFFDSAGHPPSSAEPAISIIAALPERILRGSIHSPTDRHQLEEILTAASASSAMGGLCGWVDYEGAFVFGDYRQMLIYHHADQSWSEIGNLSTQLTQTFAEPVEVGPFEATTPASDFLTSVNRIKEWIAAGDIYQANLSQAFVAEVKGGSLFNLYRALREASPAPMAAWLALDGREVLSSSPETFLKIAGNHIETRPIKGTRPRFSDPVMDATSAQELTASRKEAAELVMITDLLRNDLGQVCEFGSVRVAEMLKLESLAQVHHLVSTVTGSLRNDTSAVAALAACFPGGSITGAPKLRAMEIIHKLEANPRGLYCGAIGWFGFDGHAAFNIAIRTLVRENHLLTYQVGAGIVADSDPDKEYEETLHKAAGIRLAMDRWQNQKPTPITGNS